jgi:hypothetical protein
VSKYRRQNNAKIVRKRRGEIGRVMKQIREEEQKRSRRKTVGGNIKRRNRLSCVK